MDQLQQALLQILPPERIKSRYIDLVAYASDAGFYHLVPKVVVQPVNEEEITLLFKVAHDHQLPIVFRTGGTSLSGQSVTDGILVDLSRFWNNITVEENGLQVRTQPGITGAMVNACLRKYSRKIGPDPSSIAAAMMGGIVSNNSSGMCCGVEYNSYHTTRCIRFILPSGRIYDTGKAEDHKIFEREDRLLYDTIKQLRTEILNDTELYDRIRHKYKTKNTVGYSLNAFVDFEHPLDIFAHLLVGAEGTLAFISEVTMSTIPDPPCKSTGLLFFQNIYEACRAIVPLNNAGAKMIELMDRASLRSIENIPGIMPEIKTLPEQASALLVEFQEDNQELLNMRVDHFLQQIPLLELLNTPAFTIDDATREFYWKIRKGLFPAVGAVRASGSTVVLEDIAFPVEQLGDAITDLQQLFVKFEYHNAIIFGHARDGNIHFVVTQSFNTTGEINRYDAFLKEVVTLVVKKYQGTLKAEHGTGRNMAPFVEVEWGGKAYEIMKQLKAAADPANILNPGVIINDDQKAHIKNLKALPPVEIEVDRCVECGYCEPVCPSKNLTLTPRRRIVVRRALAALPKSSASYRSLLKDYQYQGLDTCAVDGMCATTCPVDINTGDLVKRLRKEQHSALANAIAYRISKNFTLTEYTVRAALFLADGMRKIVGHKAMTAVTSGIRKLIPSFPLWNEYLSAPPPFPETNRQRVSYTGIASVLYFPACISRTMGAAHAGRPSLTQAFEHINEVAGINVRYADKIAGTCCGQIFSSKGFTKAMEHTLYRFIDLVWHSSDQGNIPVVIDVSSCVYTLKHLRNVLPEEYRKKYDQLKIYDIVEYIDLYLLKVLAPLRKKDKVILHPVCAVQKMGLREHMIRVAKHFSDEVVIPQHWNCCGMAGDRGFLFPELTQSATKEEAAEVNQALYSGYYSSTRTCELAMSEATRKEYESIVYLVYDSIAAG